MTIRQLPYPLEFSADEHVMMPLEYLAKQMRVSRAFVRLCAEAGCPLVNGETSAARVLVWLFDHYEIVRALTGLKALAPVELPPDITARLRMANALVTLMEYARMKATNLRQKRKLRQALEKVRLLGDLGT